jgi:hypothetical protein
MNKYEQAYDDGYQQGHIDATQEIIDVIRDLNEDKRVVSTVAELLVILSDEGFI